MKFQIFGDRVLLKDTDEEKSVGGIALPESRSKAYLAMEVVAVGDGRIRGSDLAVTRRMCVAPGDRVMVQVNPLMVGNNQQKVQGEKFLTLNHHDIIARIDAGVYSLSLDTFHPVGRWVLVRVDVPEKVGQIFLPQQAQPLQSAGEVKTYLAKAGEVAMEELGVPIGSRLLLEHARVSPMSLNRIAYAYVDCASVSAATDEMDPGPVISVDSVIAGVR